MNVCGYRIGILCEQRGLHVNRIGEKWNILYQGQNIHDYPDYMTYDVYLKGMIGIKLFERLFRYNLHVKWIQKIENLKCRNLHALICYIPHRAELEKQTIDELLCTVDFPVALRRYKNVEIDEEYKEYILTTRTEEIKCRKVAFKKTAYG